ncbi:MAG: 3,4-dihydroxy-2-butanone-4-phosphate synthase [Proteobacteria bacterium]|nr:3,4-dihydroxy-2-butanone-4-phosphate synthase [Pseudomonadota bacterium]
MSQLSSPSTDVRRSAPAADRVARALAALRRGRPVLVQDDADRENEADLIVAAELIDLPVMAQLIRDCSGIVCLCLDAKHVARLGLRRMVEHNQSRHGTPFTVSIEARVGISTGVSAADRVTTVRAAIAPDAGAANIVSPGHVFPLCAAPGGVLVRRGHTEASVDLMKLAGLQAAAVLCELMNADGSMARGAQVSAYARQFDLELLSVDDVVQARMAMAAEAAPA